VKQFSMFVFLMFFSCSFVENNTKNTNDYDKICSIFKKVLAEKEEKSNDPAVIAMTIDEEMKSIHLSNEVNKAYQALTHIDSNDKYSLIKKSAEEKTKKTWDCPEMKNYFSP